MIAIGKLITVLMDDIGFQHIANALRKTEEKPTICEWLHYIISKGEEKGSVEEPMKNPKFILNFMKVRGINNENLTVMLLQLECSPEEIKLLLIKVNSF